VAFTAIKFGSFSSGLQRHLAIPATSLEDHDWKILEYLPRSPSKLLMFWSINPRFILINFNVLYNKNFMKQKLGETQYDKEGAAII